MSCEHDRLFPLGSFAVVKRGKHTGSVYVIVGIDEKDDKILIADGKSVSAKKPKRKSSRHISRVNCVSHEVAERLARGKSLDDGWLCQIVARLKENKFTACS